MDSIFSGNATLRRHPLARYFSRYTLLSLPMVLSLYGVKAQAAETFNINALEFGLSKDNRAALARYVEHDGLLAGSYRTDIYLNDEWLETRDMTFAIAEQGNALLPVLTEQDLTRLGVRAEYLAVFKERVQSQPVVPLSSFIQQASTEFDSTKLRLDIHIPQVALQQTAKDYIDPELWDSGLTTLFTNYSISGSNNQSRANKQSDLFLNLNSGVNLGGWRLRNTASYTKSTDGWKALSTYVQRDITALRSQLTLSDSFTANSVFDSVPFRGIRLAANINMVPYSERGFAPVIRGVAKTNAQVTIRQNNFIVYQTYVPPGPFELRDLSAVNTGSDMEVTVLESDGSKNVYTESSSSLPIMEREGKFNYDTAFGRYRSNYAGYNAPVFGQFSLAYGLPRGVTAYGGMLASEHYQASAVGIGLDGGHLGSLSLDSTLAWVHFAEGSKQQGLSHRLQYAKKVDATGTSFTLASYRYSTRNFYTFDEAIRVSSLLAGNHINGVNQYRSNKRSRMQANISQNLGRWGSLYFSGYQQDFWGMSGKEVTLSAGFSSNAYGINYSINFNQTHSPHYSSDKQLSLALSIPLTSSLWADYSLNTGSRSSASHQVGLNGLALNNKLSYNVQQNYGANGRNNSTSLSSAYRGTYGTANLGYNRYTDSQQLNYGVQGGVVLHPYGITLSQPLNETMILVRAPGANHVDVEGATGIETDWRGYAVVPYASAYRKNRVGINMQHAPEDVEIEHPITEVIPTDGALVLADFKTRIGQRILLTLTHHDEFVPFGATVTLGDSAGIVGYEGQVFLSGVGEDSAIRVKWGHAKEQSCRATLPDRQKAAAGNSAVLLLSAHCE